MNILRMPLLLEIIPIFHCVLHFSANIMVNSNLLWMIKQKGDLHTGISNDSIGPCRDDPIHDH